MIKFKMPMFSLFVTLMLLYSLFIKNIKFIALGSRGIFFLKKGKLEAPTFFLEELTTLDLKLHFYQNFT